MLRSLNSGSIFQNSSSDTAKKLKGKEKKKKCAFPPSTNFWTHNVNVVVFFFAAEREHVAAAADASTVGRGAAYGQLAARGGDG